MKVTFVSRADATKMVEAGYFVDNDVDLVSVSDTNREKEVMRERWKGNKADSNAAMFLNFADTDNAYSGFTAHKAESLVRFLDESFKKKKDVVVHCYLGVSRSGAVAKFYNEYYMLGDTYLENYVGHNNWVYYTLLEAAGVPTMRSYYKGLEDNQ